MTTATQPPPTWIGWLALDLCAYIPDTPTAASEPQAAQATSRSRPGAALVTLDVSVRTDIVSFWIGSRTLAVADRDALAAWVGQPDRPLPVDDLEFLVVDRQLCLRIDGTGPYVLTAAAASDLVRAL